MKDNNNNRIMGLMEIERTARNINNVMNTVERNRKSSLYDVIELIVCLAIVAPIGILVVKAFIEALF